MMRALHYCTLCRRTVSSRRALRCPGCLKVRVPLSRCSVLTYYYTPCRTIVQSSAVAIAFPVCSLLLRRRGGAPGPAACENTTLRPATGDGVSEASGV